MASTLPEAGTVRYGGNARLAALRNVRFRARSAAHYIQADIVAVLYAVPRRSKYIQSLEALMTGIGRAALERTRNALDASGRPIGHRHIGWRWPCDCLAFARPEGDYLWVPCHRHDAARQPAHAASSA